MNARAAVFSGLVVGSGVLAVAWIFELPLDRAAVLAPVIVVCIAALAGLVVFWLRAGIESLRQARHPRLIVGGALALVLLGVVLSLLGVQPPHE